MFAKPFDQFKLSSATVRVVGVEGEGEQRRIYVSVTEGPASVAKSGKKGRKVPARTDAELASSNPFNSVDDIREGMEVSCKVRDIFQLQMNVSIGLHVKARIHVTEVTTPPPSATPAQLKAASDPFSKYKKDDLIPRARVLSVVDSENVDSHLPLTKNTPTKRKLVELTLQPAVLSSAVVLNKPLSSTPTFQTLRKDQVVAGWVHVVAEDGLWVHVSPTVRGRVFLLDVSHDVDVLRNLQSHYQPGQCIQAKVMRVDSSRKELDLSIRVLSHLRSSIIASSISHPGLRSRLTCANSECVERGNDRAWSHRAGHVELRCQHSALLTRLWSRLSH